MTLRLNESDGATTFELRVVPRASRTEIAGEHDGALRVRVAAPPVEGAANDELTRFFAKLLGVSRGDVQIVAGRASKNKVVRVRGVTREAIVSLARGQ
jgi:uncharacterized protein (TIGR00251 family)